MNEPRLERTQIHCHECNKYLTVEFDVSLNGNHVVRCQCGHEHCRVIKDGTVTDIRWDQRNGPTIQGWVISMSSTATTAGMSVTFNNAAMTISASATTTLLLTNSWAQTLRT